MHINTIPVALKSLVLFLFLNVCGAQEALLAQADEYGTDELFRQARAAAFDQGEYDKAREFAYRALKRSPNYHEIRIFVARTYAWQGDYDKSREELLYVMNRDPDNYQALSAMVDVERWSDQYIEALEWCKKALEYYPADREFLYRSASLLASAGRYGEAEKAYSELLDIYPGYTKARKALQQMQLGRMKYKASVSYRHDQFAEIFDPWNFLELQLNRQTSIGSVIGRLQYANRFSTDGLQVNIDAYPTIASGFYAYLSGGYSHSSIFPRYRLGASLYKSLPAAFEIEGGIRYLDFLSSDVVIYTASVSKYYGNYLFTGRTYLVPSGVGDSHSFSLLIRRYLGGAVKYIGISSGFGTASDEIRFEEDLRTLDSWFINAEAQFPVAKRIYIGGNAGYDSEEFINFTRERFSVKVYLAYRF